jgi:hypothetical protein
MNGIVFNPVNANDIPPLPNGVYALFVDANGVVKVKDSGGVVSTVAPKPVTESPYLWNFDRTAFPEIPVTNYGNNRMLEFVANKCVEGVHKFSVVGMLGWFNNNGGHVGDYFDFINQFGDEDTKTFVMITKVREFQSVNDILVEEYNITTMQEYPFGNTSGSYNNRSTFHKFIITADADLGAIDLNVSSDLNIGGSVKKLYYQINQTMPRIEI